MPSPRELTRAVSLGAGAVVVGLLAGGCGRAPLTVCYDLAVEAPLARQVVAGGMSVVVAPPSTVFAGDAWAERRGAEARLVSAAFLDWDRPRDRTLQLLLRPPGWGSGHVAVALNRTALAPLRLGPGVDRHPVSLPGEAQRPGTNRLRLTFQRGADPNPPPPAGGAPRLLEVSLQGAGGRGSERSFEVRPEGEVAVLAQAASTRLEYGLRLPEEAELRVTPRLSGLAGGGARFRIGLRLDGEEARELLELDVAAPGASREVRLPLDAPAGRAAVLTLGVSSLDGVAGAVGEWVAPRVLGRQLPAREAPAPKAVRDLRRRLREAPVLLIVLDAAAAGHLGCYGYGRNTSPEIDRLASEGAVFDRAYTTASYTSLAMASLWTARHPEQHHHGRRASGPLPENRPVLAERLSRKGVESTAFVGNPNAGAPQGLTRGFTRVRPLRLTSKGGHPLDLDEIPQGPSLTYLHYLEPHFPYDPPPPFDRMFGAAVHLPARAPRDPAWFHDVNAGRVHPTADDIADFVRLYDGNLAAVDREIGQLRDRLEAAGRWDELLVILTADHGEEFLEHGHLTHAAQVYEESVRIPLVIRLPGAPRPERHETAVDLVDLGTTLADVMGVADDGGGARGRSLLPLLAGGSLEPRPIVTRNASERPTYGFLQGDLKLIHDTRSGATRLFDLGRDPGEEDDLAGRRPVAAEQLRQSLYRWLRDLDRGAPAAGGEPTLSAEDEAALRALGYLESQDGRDAGL